MAYTVTPDVPYYAQQTVKECWFASLKMLFAHRYGQKDIRTDTKDYGLDNEDFERFARLNGLVAPLANQVKRPIEVAMETRISGPMGSWTVGQLETLLRNHGPLWVAAVRHTAHIVVAIGVTETEVILHDPQAGPNLKLSIERFNKTLNPTAPHQILFLPRYCSESVTANK